MLTNLVVKLLLLLMRLIRKFFYIFLEYLMDNSIMHVKNVTGLITNNIISANK